MSVTLTQLFRFIPGGTPSNRLVDRFNSTAKGMGVPLQLIRNPDAPHLSASEMLHVLVPDGQVRPSVWNDALIEDTARVLGAVEARRLELVRASFAYHERLDYRPPLERLSETERRAVFFFSTTVKPILDRIEARQQHPLAQELAAQMVYAGDFYSRVLFARFHRDTAAGAPYARKPEVSLFCHFPDPPPINGMIDPSIPLTEIARLGATLPPDAEELRPTTVLTKEGDRIVAVPLPLHPPFREDHQKLAEELERIASLNIDGPLDSSLQDQLRKWAHFFRTGTAADEAAAVQATIDAGEGGGGLRVHIGPSESYWRDNLKYPYLLQVGIRDTEIAGELAKRKDTFLALEASLTGIPHYTPRQLSTRGGFADPIYQAVIGGFVGSYHNAEVAGNNFPNHPYEGVEGSNRFILLEVVTFGALRKKTVLSRLLDEDVSDWDAVSSMIEFTVNHESGHLLGPPRQHLTPTGQRMATVFGDHWGSADEPKSDLTSACIVRLRHAAGELSDPEARDRLRGLVGDNFSQKYKGKELFSSGQLTDHPFGIMMEVGWFFRTGAYSLTDSPNGRRIHVDYDRLEEEAHTLFRKIISFQAAGDLEGFLAFAREMVAAIPDEADRMIQEASKDLRTIFVERYLA